MAFWQSHAQATGCDLPIWTPPMRTGPAKGATKPASSLIWLFTLVVWTGVVVALGAAELKPQTIKAFDRYVEVTEARMQTELDGEAPFLWVDRLPDDDRDEANAKLRAGEVVIDRLETRDGDEKIKIPDGTIHHWIGTVLIPGVTLEQTMALIQDYDRYAEIYGPDVRQSKLLSRDGSRFRVYLQLFKKKVVTVVLNTEYDADRTPRCPARLRAEPHHTDRGGRAAGHAGRTRKTRGPGSWVHVALQQLLLI